MHIHDLTRILVNGPDDTDATANRCVGMAADPATNISQLLGRTGAASDSYSQIPKDQKWSLL